jgi:hypothetical protein
LAFPSDINERMIFNRYLVSINSCGECILLCVFSVLILSFPWHVSEGQTSTGRDTQLKHTENVKVLPHQNKRWALLIGVDKYEDSNISSLKGSSNDARMLRESLIRSAGFPEDQVIVLSSDAPAERQPTRRNILRRLSNLAGLVPKDGLLLISFAGHGIDRNGRGFLIPSDATFAEDLSLLEETAVSVDSIKQRIKDTGVQQVVIILDACRSYPTGRSDSSNPLTRAFTSALNFDVRNREVDAFAVLYATEVGYRAYEYGEKRQGYFTWAIAQGLNGAAANERGEVTLSSLVKYLENTVPKLVAIDYGAKVIQRPFANIEGYRADELLIAMPGTRMTKQRTNSDTASDSPAAGSGNARNAIASKEIGSLRVVLKSAMRVKLKDQQGRSVNGIRCAFEFINLETQRPIVVAMNAIAPDQRGWNSIGSYLRSTLVDDNGGLWRLYNSNVAGMSIVGVGIKTVSGFLGADSTLYNPAEIVTVLSKRDDLNSDVAITSRGTQYRFIFGSTTAMEPGQSLTVSVTFSQDVNETTAGAPPTVVQMASEIVVGVMTTSTKKSYALHNITFDRVSLSAGRM